MLADQLALSKLEIDFQETDDKLYKAALEQLRKTIRESTSSMTSVPKPLKFLMPHYDALKAVYEKMKDSDCQVRLVYPMAMHGAAQLDNAILLLYTKWGENRPMIICGDMANSHRTNLWLLTPQLQK
jgi:hypothetical protein